MVTHSNCGTSLLIDFLGHGAMDESHLTGQPFQITKTSGSTVISGAITQKVIDVLAALNALRAAFPARMIHDV